MPIRLQGQPHTTPPVPAEDGAASRSPVWTKPVLSSYGDVRQLTMGPTPGTGESGSPLIYKPHI